MASAGLLPTPGSAWPGRSEALVVSASHAVNKNPMYPPFPAEMEIAIFGMGCFWGAERMFWKLPGVFSTQVGFSGGITPNPTYKEVRTGMTGHAEVVRVVFDPQIISYEDLLKCFWENHDPTQGMKQYEDVGTQYRSAIYTVGAKQLESALRSRRAYEQVQESLLPKGVKLLRILNGKTKAKPALVHRSLQMAFRAIQAGLLFPSNLSYGRNGLSKNYLRKLLEEMVAVSDMEPWKQSIRPDWSYMAWWEGAAPKELASKQLGPITTEIREAGDFYYAEDDHQQYLHKNPDGFCGLKGTGVACLIGKCEP